jgi:hypothetical protein
VALFLCSAFCNGVYFMRLDYTRYVCVCVDCPYTYKWRNKSTALQKAEYERTARVHVTTFYVILIVLIPFQQHNRLSNKQIYKKCTRTALTG